MKRAILELAVILGIMLIAGTVYTISNQSDSEKHLPWVSPVLPKGIPELPAPQVEVVKPGPTDSTPPPTVTDEGGTPQEEPAPEPDGPFRFVEHDEVLEHFNGGLAIFIDARRTREYVAGHITGAKSISYWEADADEKIAALREEAVPEMPIIVYCTRSKDCEDSQYLAQKLHDVGFLDLMVYRGGFPEWSEKESGAVTEGTEPGER